MVSILTGFGWEIDITLEANVEIRLVVFDGWRHSEICQESDHKVYDDEVEIGVKVYLRDGVYIAMCNLESSSEIATPNAA